MAVKSANKSTYSIRWGLKKDRDAIIEIEKDVFDYPWSRKDYDETLKSRDCIDLVVELDGKIVGYIVYSLSPTYINVLNFAVARSQWRTGIGTAILNKMKGKLNQKRNLLRFEVTDANLGGHLFLKKNGFIVTEIFPGAYDVNDDDMYIFEYRD
jgi:ribosomal protein S18 acetylase RimI-like enzyme